ncbi:hypothetical protein [Agrobacterium pusense]|uniref:hypothetical protein n=1 Tax=Agrobacterium pusense TaxID=648995 RepID=UPI0028A01F2E|nr:hypothetical protein [Agrobacterium pusense]
MTIGTTQRHPRQLTPQQVPKHLRIRPPHFVPSSMFSSTCCRSCAVSPSSLIRLLQHDQTAVDSQPGRLGVMGDLYLISNKTSNLQHYIFYDIKLRSRHKSDIVKDIKQEK